MCVGRLFAGPVSDRPPSQPSGVEFRADLANNVGFPASQRHVRGCRHSAVDVRCRSRLLTVRGLHGLQAEQIEAARHEGNVARLEADGPHDVLVAARIRGADGGPHGAHHTFAEAMTSEGIPCTRVDCPR